MKKLPLSTSLPCDRAGSMLRKTLALLDKESRTNEALSLYLHVPLPWISKLRARVIKTPSVNRVQFIYEKLSGEKL